METLYELKYNDVDALRLFVTKREKGTNNMRIHYHSMIEFTLIVRGSGVYKTREHTYPIDAGSLFFFRPNEPHFVTDIAEGGMEFLNLHIAPYFLYSSAQGGLSPNYLSVLSHTAPLSSNKINDLFPVKDMEEIKRLLFLVKEELEKKQSDYLTLAVNYISTLFIKISRLFCLDEPSSSEKQSYGALLDAIPYIDARFKEQITLDEIATHVGYSRCYFSSEFKKRMGMSAWDYINIKRVEAALTLIRETDKSILQIATECGFNNCVNFYKIFKKYTNLSPSSYRK